MGKELSLVTGTSYWQIDSLVNGSVVVAGLNMSATALNDIRRLEKTERHGSGYPRSSHWLVSAVS